MIYLTKSGMAGFANLEELAHQFERSHVFRLPRLLHSDLIQMISPRLESCTWMAHEDGKIATEEKPVDATPASILHLATNTPEFLDTIRLITRCEQIKWFSGRVYRMSRDHFDSWHSDRGTPQDRLVGMSVNLSPHRYQGGVFRLRNKTTGETLCELPNTGRGDAICFRISSSLEHMVTPLVGSEHKIAFAGWFQSGDTDFYSMVRGAPLSGPND